MNRLSVDEAAMKVITDKLVDPWHKTFARDVVEMYLKHSCKHTEGFIPAPEHQVKDRPGIHQNADGSKTFDYVDTEGNPLKIKLQAGYDGKIVNGVMQIIPSQNLEKHDASFLEKMYPNPYDK